MGDADVEMDIALDSGCVDHVCAKSGAPSGAGFSMIESGRSRGKRCFIVGNGGRVPNEGGVALTMAVGTEDVRLNTLDSVFQIAQVTRPIMSVSKVCGVDVTCTSDKHRGIVRDSKGNAVMEFKRHGGIYIARLTIKRGKSPFGGPVR